MKHLNNNDRSDSALGSTTLRQFNAFSCHLLISLEIVSDLSFKRSKILSVCCLQQITNHGTYLFNLKKSKSEAFWLFYFSLKKSSQRTKSRNTYLKRKKHLLFDKNWNELILLGCLKKTNRVKWNFCNTCNITYEIYEIIIKVNVKYRASVS